MAAALADRSKQQQRAPHLNHPSPHADPCPASHSPPREHARASRPARTRTSATCGDANTAGHLAKPSLHSHSNMAVTGCVRQPGVCEAVTGTDGSPGEARAVQLACELAAGAMLTCWPAAYVYLLADS